MTLYKTGMLGKQLCARDNNTIRKGSELPFEHSEVHALWRRQAVNKMPWRVLWGVVGDPVSPGSTTRYLGKWQNGIGPEPSNL